MAVTGKLKLKTGGESAEIYELSDQAVTIGRSPECEYVIDDLEVSRKHTLIQREGDSFFVEDLNSTNGTFLNGKRLRKKKVLTNGDLITIGEQHVLEFELAEKSEELKPDQEVPLSPAAQSQETAEQDAPEEKRTEIAEEPTESGWKEVKKTTPKKDKVPLKVNWKIVLLAALAFFVVFCVLPFVVIEATDQWCNLFSGFFNSISPGVCP